ncbi:TetR family transcriptional regulator [Psychromicrobium sp. YIM B11713]|uniref:TetR family transcriptional regulator n=1 Tax=Psychromicrobium sp. YIM B11713 TaxID=3145233 RepID=UPI00374F226A
MSSIKDVGPPHEDLSTPAKIRDAAVRCFADSGFQKTSVRSIASAAGVSPGLIIHHFGSKDGLREACDEFILNKVLTKANEESSLQGFQSVLQNHLNNPGEFDLEVSYLRRAVSEDSPMGHKVITLVIDETEAVIRAGIADGTMNPSSDARALAVFVAMTSLAMLTMSEQINEALDAPGFNQAMTNRIAIPALELFTHGLYVDDSYLKAAQEVLSSTSKESNRP